ncbi:hypothetical protein [Nocardia sp. NBC_01388]|uniref:SRPBCC family protein n=1 Tax=Nocardia sp. NBC_01388 TaxID=2903596 RepID=UPI00324792C0
MSFDEVLARARPETTQIHRVIIAAPAARIWQAVADPDWTVRYGFGGPLISIIISGDLESEGFGGGYPFMLSDLKSLLETGHSLPVSRPTRKS